MRLWLDKVGHQSQPDIWLELLTDDLDGALMRFGDAVPVRDELEPLGSLKAHWISDPAGNVLLLHQKAEFDDH
jgi:hypothetical protein